MTTESIKKAFKNIFEAEPILFKSPGRINIIGEHTDYNGGFVLPAAIDKAIYVAISKRDDEQIHLYAANYNAKLVYNINEIKIAEHTWANYILGVTNELIERGYALSGFNLYLYGDVPLGAGLSSSAAVECAVALALSHINQLSIDRLELALISQQAEHKFAGVNCGIMDQFASVFGKKDRAMLLDCQSLNYEYIPLVLEGYKLVLFNTNVKHSLGDSAYNKRRQQCEQGVQWIKEHHPNVELLRDAHPEMLDKYVKPKDEEVYLKCSYVVEEIARVKQAVTALKNGNLEELGKLMYQTHHGLSSLYEVSCNELDFLVDSVKNLDFVLGARMMGGGFGGCTINIVKNEYVEQLIKMLQDLYVEKFNLQLGAYVVETGNGSEKIE